jgi:hypothetical protein
MKFAIAPLYGFDDQSILEERAITGVYPSRDFEMEVRS